MDPLSIVAASTALATQAWTLGNKLYQFIRDTRNVNDTIREIADGVHSLSSLCQSVSQQVESTPTLANDEILAPLRSQLSTCERLNTQLDAVVERLKTEHTYPVRQAIRQARPSWSQEEIDSYRTRIQSCTSNLQLVLQLLALKAICLAPHVTTELLETRLRNIETAVGVNEPRLDAAMLQCASDYLSQARTIYARSVDGSLQDNSGRHIASWLGTIETLRRENVDDLMSELSSQDSLFSAAGAPQPFGRHSAAHSSSSGQTSSANNPFLDARNDSAREPSSTENVDVEYDYEVELASAAVRAGKQALDARQYARAESMLDECLRHIQSLPQRLRQSYDLNELHYYLAVCSFHQQDLPVAEAALATVVERASTSDTDADRKLHAGILLAQVYVKADKLDLARATGENVYRGRRRTEHRDAAACYEALAFLARVYELLSMPDRAAIHQEMIPRDSRRTYIAQFERLGPVRTTNDSTPTRRTSRALGNDDATLVSERSESAVVPRAVTRLNGPALVKANDLLPRGTFDIKLIALDPWSTGAIVYSSQNNAAQVTMFDLHNVNSTISHHVNTRSTPKFIAYSKNSKMYSLTYKSFTTEIKIFSSETFEQIHSWLPDDFKLMMPIQFAPSGPYILLCKDAPEAQVIIRDIERSKNSLVAKRYSAHFLRRRPGLAIVGSTIRDYITEQDPPANPYTPLYSPSSAYPPYPAFQSYPPYPSYPYTSYNSPPSRYKTSGTTIVSDLASGRHACSPDGNSFLVYTARRISYLYSSNGTRIATIDIGARLSFLELTRHKYVGAKYGESLHYGCTAMHFTSRGEIVLAIMLYADLMALYDHSLDRWWTLQFSDVYRNGFEILTNEARTLLVLHGKRTVTIYNLDRTLDNLRANPDVYDLEKTYPELYGKAPPVQQKSRRWPWSKVEKIKAPSA